MQALEALALYFLINLQCVDKVAPASHREGKIRFLIYDNLKTKKHITEPEERNQAKVWKANVFKEPSNNLHVKSKQGLSQQPRGLSIPQSQNTQRFK
jgi:hypothetical protein